MRLSHKDYEILLQTIYELHEHRTLEEFRARVPAILLKLVPSEHFFWPTYRINPIGPLQEMVDYVESQPRLTDPVRQMISANLMDHPFTKYMFSGGLEKSLKLSDFMTQAQFRRWKHSQLHLDWGFRFNLMSQVKSRPGTGSAIGMCNYDRDFTELDRLKMNLIRRHFEQAQEQAEWVSKQTEKSALSLEQFKLTSRELQVARWLGLAKSSQEIAIIIGCKPRTVEKHVERILEKLGVENRQAAILMINGISSVGEASEPSAE